MQDSCLQPLEIGFQNSSLRSRIPASRMIIEQEAGSQARTRNSAFWDAGVISNDMFPCSFLLRCGNFVSNQYQLFFTSMWNPACDPFSLSVGTAPFCR